MLSGFGEGGDVKSKLGGDAGLLGEGGGFRTVFNLKGRTVVTGLTGTIFEGEEVKREVRRKGRLREEKRPPDFGPAKLSVVVVALALWLGVVVD